MRLRSLLCLGLFAIATASGSLFAQVFEVSPYGGFYWPGDNSEVGKFESNQTLGVRGGFYVTKAFEVGANYSWSNHFQPSDSNAAAAFAGALGFTQPAVRANMVEGEFSYNLGKHRVFGSVVNPYLVAGGGGLTTNIKSGDHFVLNVRPVAIPFGTTYVAKDVLNNGDTFFTFSYGGGIKAERLWGPMGLFGDVRGRTIPNFFTGHGTNWPEVSAGLHFSWGER